MITDEKVIEEDGKFYFPMKVAMEDTTSSAEDQEDSFKRACNLLTGADENIGKEQLLRICNRYGECNILNADMTLKRYLLHGKKVCESILKSLDKEEHADRVREIVTELSDLDVALKTMR